MTPSLNIMFPYQLSDTCSGIAVAFAEKVSAAIAVANLSGSFFTAFSFRENP